MSAVLRVIASISVMVALAAPSLAAGTTTTKGSVKSLDPKACTVTLTDNTTYQFGKNCNLTKLRLGEQIAVVWKQTGTVRSAVQVFVAM